MGERETEQAAADEARQRPLREAWQAVLGALNNAEEETQALMGRLVELGTFSREESTRMFAEVRDLVEQRRNELAARVDSAVGDAIKRLTIPSEDDIAAVAQKLSELERRVEALDDIDPPRRSTQIPVSKLARGMSRAQPRKKKKPHV
ncbi:MAG: phasin family protein [Deltaproteobacteria bacterium]|nr:phasin family protein [Deltaproteobacteria bacterium]